MESLRDKAQCARDKIHPPCAPEQRARFAEGHGEGKGDGVEGEKGEGGGGQASEQWQKRA